MDSMETVSDGILYHEWLIGGVRAILPDATFVELKAFTACHRGHEAAGSVLKHASSLNASCNTTKESVNMDAA